MPAEVRIEGAGASAAPRERDRRTGRDRLDREDVEVEAQHGRPRRHHRQLRRRHRALVHAVELAARARRDLDRGGRAGRLALRAAAVAAGARSGRDRRRGADRRARRRSASPRSRCARPPTARSPRVSEDIERLRFNVCVAHIYEFANASERRSASAGDRADAPTIAGRCGKRSTSWYGCSADDAAPRRGVLGCARPQDAGRRRSPGRELEPELLIENTITLPVQINGKKRG